MISTHNLARLERLTARLPFHLDDLEQANETFEAWVKHGNDDDQKIIDLWTYCFVWRNIVVKFNRNADLNRSDLDMLVASIFERAVERRYTVRDETRYTNWVSVICRNYFVNYLRSRKKMLSIEDPDSLPILDEPAEFDDDFVVLKQAINSAIERLPQYLQIVIRMRLVERRSYEEISEVMGKKIEVVRSYYNKAVNRLREDSELKAFIKRDFSEDIENQGMRRR
jgi:RNA polymerase sigma-70 factor (ECF subfamily)